MNPEPPENPAASSRGGSLGTGSGGSGSGMQRVDVAAGLIFRRRRLLITQRPADSHLANLWEFPGGKIEPGESFQEGLIRELHEELRVRAEVLHLIDEVMHDYPEKLVKLRFFCCRLLADSPEPQAVGVQNLAWISAEELDIYPFPPADARLLTILKNTPDLWK